MSDIKEYIKLSIDRFGQSKELISTNQKLDLRFFEECRPILDNLEDVIFIADKTGRFLFVNKASERRTGVHTEKLIGLHYLDIIDPKYHRLAQNSFENAMDGKTGPPLEMELQNPFGEMITVEVIYKTLYEDNIPVGILAASRDVTDRKQAQQALKKARDELEVRVEERTADLQKANDLLKNQIDERIRAEEKLKQSELKYRGLFENAGDAVFIMDIQTETIIDANRQAAHLTGRPAKELIGMHQSRLHPAEDAGYYRDKFNQHVQDGPVFDLEAEVVKTDGTVVPVFIYSGLIHLQGKTVIQAVFRDISKERIISDLKGELEAKKLVNRAKAIIAKHYRINDSEAMKMLQKESRRRSRKLKEVAHAVVSSKFILD